MRIILKLNKRMFLIWQGYPLAIALVVLVTLIKYFTPHSIISPDWIVQYLLAIVPIALFFGLGPAVFTSIVSALANDFFFVPPLHSLAFSDQHLQVIVILLVVGVIISLLAWTLRQNSRFNSALTDHAPNPIVVTNPDSSIKYVNPALETLTGFNAAEITGRKSPYPWWPQKDISQFDAENVSGREKDFNRYERSYWKKNGEPFWVEVTLRSVKDRSGIEYYIANWMDITERKKAEEAVRKKELQFEKLFEVMAEGAILWDSNLRGIKWNAEAERIFRMRREDSEGQPFNWSDWTVHPQWQLVGPDGTPVSDEVRASLRALKEKRAVRNLESGLKWPDGSTTWIIASAVPLFDSLGNIEGILGTFGDTTMLKQLLDRATQSEMQFQKLFDSMTEGVSLVTPEGRVIKSNLADSQILGLRDGEVGNFRITGWKYFSADGQEIPLEKMATYQAVKTRHPVRNPEVGVIRNDGSHFWLSVNATPLLDENGEVTAVVRVITDITEQKRIKEEREQFTMKLLDVQEGERKRIARELHDDAAQNLALLALEIDNLLQTCGMLPEKAIDSLKKLREDANRTHNELRRYSHELRPGVLDYLGLEAALEGLVEDVKSRGLMQAGLEIEGHGDRLKEEVELALFRIAQEALNNVWKHSGANQARISLEYTPTKVLLMVTDNGKGFSVDERPEAGAASGLGLIGMRERAQLIGAKLDIESIPGQGTKVLVEVSNSSRA